MDLNADIIDSRDIIERKQELQDEYDYFVEERDQAKLDAEEADEAFDENAHVFYDEDELNQLAKICEDGESQFGSSWESGVTLIAEHYFADYARDFAEDVGAISREYNWPNNHIDWEAAGNELMMDYSCIEINGTYYYGRD